MNLNLISALFCILILSACVGTTIESAQMANDKVTRDKYMESALQGDADAQYMVGLSFCCAPRSDVDAFYNNRKATEFLCKAARQNHARSAFQIGNFHSGDRIDGIRWVRRAANLIRGDSLENPIIAYYWYPQAKLNGAEEAIEHLQLLEKQDISQFADPRTTPCTVDEVYFQPSNRE